MSHTHFQELSYKTIPRSSYFLHSVWRPSEVVDIEAHVYNDYYKKGHFNYVNDFVHNNSKTTSELSPDQVVCIHEDNKIKASMKNVSQFKRKEFGVDESNKNQIYSTKCKDKNMSKPFSDSEITDGYLDSLHIPKGKREDRLILLKNQSDISFRFLCLHIGTERIVKLRRLLLNKCFNSMIEEGVVIGSKSEGLDMAGSDIDILLCSHRAHEKGDNSSNTISDYEYDSLMNNIQPGYVMLKTKGNTAIVLPSNAFNSQMEAMRNNKPLRDILKTEIHGPAVKKSANGKEFDFVISVKSESWPNIAMEWINRKRKFRWPSQKMVHSIVKKGCNIVPVGSSRNHESDEDWRLSFCMAEQELIETFNHSQLIVYGALKLVLKEILDKDNDAHLICSYFLKTIMFWVVEETSSSNWIPQNLLLCFQMCIQRLIKFVKEENCPNYFVISNNMFHERINSSNKENLLRVLYNIANNGWQWMMETQTLKLFPYFISGETNKMKELKKEISQKEQFDIFNLVYQIVFRYRQHICFIMSRVSPMNKHLLSTMCKVPLIRQKTLPVLCHYIDTDSQNLGNKALYTLRKLHMQFLVMASTDDILCGKVLLASWLYQQGKHNECLNVTDICLQNLDLCIMHENKRIMKTELYEVICTNDIPNIQYLSSSDLMFPFESSIIVRELAEIFGGNSTKIFYQYKTPITYYCPRNYMYFLRCLCYFKLGDAVKCEYAYTEMNSVCERYCESFKLLHSFNNFILKLVCNKIRHNITFDFNDCFEAANVLNQHIDEFDIADNHRLDFCNNTIKLLETLGLNNGGIMDIVCAKLNQSNCD